MNRKRVFILFVVLLALLIPLSVVTAQGPTPKSGRAPTTNLGTAFTYQGQLEQNGTPVNATCNLQFGLWNSASGGALVSGTTTQTVPAVSVNNGLFTAAIDFGASGFNGDARWLAVAVQCPPALNYTPMTTRQALTPAPMALTLPGLYTQQNFTSTNVIGGYSGNSVTSGIVGATIGGGGAISGTNRVTDDYGVVGGGYNNVAGGKPGDYTSYATVGGGISNFASNEGTTIAGGYQNTASNLESTVGGGAFNIADGHISNVDGGIFNRAGGVYATVGGGGNNSALGAFSSVPGGVGAVATHCGEMALGSGDVITPGIAQASVYVLRGTTQNATPTELLIYCMANDRDRITLATNRAITFDILIIGRSATYGYSGGYQVRGVIERTGGGITQLVGSPVVTTLGEDDATWTVSVSADNINDALVIFVTGSASDSVSWVATARTVEVTY